MTRIGTIGHRSHASLLAGSLICAISNINRTQNEADSASSPQESLQEVSTFLRDRSTVVQTYKDKLAKALGVSDKVRNKRLLNELDRIDFGPIMVVDVSFKGYEYIVNKDGYTVLTGEQAIKQMKKAYDYRSIRAARRIAGLEKYANGLSDWTWRRIDFEEVLKEFFILLASKVPLCLSNRNELTTEQLKHVEEVAIDQICTALNNHK